MNADKQASQGVISSSELYSLSEIERRLGLGKDAMRVARRRGLTVHRFGSRGFVDGGELIEFLKAQRNSA